MIRFQKNDFVYRASDGHLWRDDSKIGSIMNPVTNILGHRTFVNYIIRDLVGVNREIKRVRCPCVLPVDRMLVMSTVNQRLGRCYIVPYRARGRILQKIVMF